MIYKIIFFVTIIFTILVNKSLAECNFKEYENLENLKKVSSINSIEVDVKKKRKFYKNFARIVASNTENIPNKLKKNFNAKVIVHYTFGKCTFKASVRQLGDWKDHINIINGKPQRSLKISLKNGNILNAVKFKLFIPKTRENYNEILGSIILKKLGYLSPETFETKIILNGSKFKMLFQEDFTKEFLEKNSRREGPIYEGDESLLWSYKNKSNFELEDISLSRLTNYKWFLKGKNSEYIVLKSFNLLQQSYLEYINNLTSSNLAIYPNKKNDKIFQNYYFILTSMNGWHALRPHNRKFYYNSLIDKFEPIYYDGMLNLNRPLSTNMIKEDLSMFDDNYNYSKIKLLENKKFQNKILNMFEERIVNKNDSSKIFFNDSIKNIINNSYLLYEKIKSNKNKKNYDKESKKKLISDYISKTDRHKISQKNIIQIVKNSNKYIALTNNDEKIILNNNQISSIINRNKLGNERYVILHVDDINKNHKINLKKINFNNSKLATLIYSDGITINLNEDSKTIDFSQNKYSDWILIKNADLSNWKINFYGKKEKINNNSQSQRFNKQGLTGCLNIFNSTFNNTFFNIFNVNCEDGLNIIRSKGLINSILVNNAYSDAIDLDFSNIKISNIVVRNAGNDCVDVSGGNYILDKSELKNCGDKGLSVGEMSVLNGNYINIENSNIGISVKDLSKSMIDTFKAKNINICVESKKKKQEFGGAIASFNLNSCPGLYNSDYHSVIYQNLNEF